MIRRISREIAKAQGLKRYLTGHPRIVVTSPSGSQRTVGASSANVRAATMIAGIATSTCARSRYTSSVIARRNGSFNKAR
jgi:hypothetical protein